MGQQTSQPKITPQDRAIYQLKRQRDALKQYQRKLASTVERETDLARQALRTGKPDKAKFYLRLKKRQQGVIDTSYSQLETLEGLIGTIEFKLIEKDVLYGLEQGNKVLKTLNSEMSVDKIDRVLDDLEDERVRVDEVSDMLGLGLSNMEEHEVEDELAALEREVKREQAHVSAEAPLLPDTPSHAVFPEAPKEEPASPSKELPVQTEQDLETQPIAA